MLNIYLTEVLKEWKRKCDNKGVEGDDDMLFSLSFADTEVIFVGDEEGAHYMLRTLNEEYLR